MKPVIKQVVSVAAIFALLGLYNSNINNVVLTDTNFLIFSIVAFAGVVVALALQDKTKDKCFEQKVKESLNKAVVPTILLLVISHPKTYKFVSLNIPKDIISVPLVKELTNAPTTEGLALHTGVFALVYYLALTKLQL